MTDHHSSAQSLIFGFEPMWIALGVFVLAYLLIMSERVNRAIVATLAAGILVLFGVHTHETALNGVDFNTIGLLTGMMVIVAITRKSGIFQYLAIWSTKRVNADPWGVLIMLMLVTAVMSSLLDNVTTVLLIAPVTLLITEALKVHPYPFLFAEIFASNVGGAATLIGDPPNIMIGSAVGLSFNDFLWNLGPVVVVLLILIMLALYLIWGRKMQADPHDREKVMHYNEADAITDKRLLVKSLGVLVLVLGGFIFAHDLGQEPSTIALAGAALLLLLDNHWRSAEQQSETVQATFADVEWVTIFFFVGLFIVVHALEHTGVLNLAATEILAATGSDLEVMSMTILWVAALASAVVDNIPFVATAIPLIESMAPSFGGPAQIETLWWSLALGACLGGNGSLVGASANLIVAGFAERAGHPIHFLGFMLLAFPMMLFTIAVASAYVYVRYL